MAIAYETDAWNVATAACALALVILTVVSRLW